MPSKALLSQNIPALAVSIEVSIASLCRRMQGEVRRGMRQVEEEGFVFFLGLLEKLDRIVVKGIGGIKVIGIEFELGLLALR